MEEYQFYERSNQQDPIGRQGYRVAPTRPLASALRQAGQHRAHRRHLSRLRPEAQKLIEGSIIKGQLDDGSASPIPPDDVLHALRSAAEAGQPYTSPIPSVGGVPAQPQREKLRKS